MPRDNDAERLAARIAQAQHNEEQILARREREAAGVADWVAKHKGQQSLPIRRDGGPIRDRTVSKNPWE